MRVLVSGPSGFIGLELSILLQSHGYIVIPLRRGPAKSDGNASWNPAHNEIDLSAAGPLDAIVHLAGENIVARWTPGKKRAIYDSRAHGTRLLAEAVTQLDPAPAAFLSASATGYYGNRGSEWLDESAPAGIGFLANVCRDWEAAAAPVANKGIRTAFLRFGLVLGMRGGALAKMLPVFRAGVGGRLGGGTQYWSWISIDDLVAAIEFILQDARLRGPINMVAPAPVTNAEFTKTLGRVFKRPAFFNVPPAMVRLMFGTEMANETFLSSARVRPRALEESGFKFRDRYLETALRRLLGRT